MGKLPLLKNEHYPKFIQALFEPRCYSHPVSDIRIRETHISWILLTGSFAYKIKKPVKYSFVDFSTLEKRRWFCEEEIRLNRRLASDLYLEVVPLTGSPSEPWMGGGEQPFEFAVKMRQFSHDLQTELLNDSYEGEEAMSDLAEQIGRFHMKVEHAGPANEYGTAEAVWGSIQECFQEIPQGPGSPAVVEQLEWVCQWVEKEWKRLRPTFVERKRTGWIRECHGDLHLGNIAVFQGQLCVFDALEFAPHLRWIDVMSEVAFLVMDLERRERRDLGFVFLNKYLEYVGDYAGLRVFRFYRMYRALVRAKVAGIRWSQVSPGDPLGEEVAKEFLEYLRLASEFLSPPAPRLFLMHGVSGSGKTTVSTHLLKVLGAVRVRSDVERKRLGSKNFKASSEQEKNVQLYSQGMNEVTYVRLLEVARGLLSEDLSVIVDATFLRVDQREPFFLLAKEKNIPIHIIAVGASENLVKQRISKRSQKGVDVSDATLEVLQRQSRIQEPFNALERSCVISVDTTGPQSIQQGVNHVCDVIGHNPRSQ